MKKGYEQIFIIFQFYLKFDQLFQMKLNVILRYSFRDEYIDEGWHATNKPLWPGVTHIISLKSTMNYHVPWNKHVENFKHGMRKFNIFEPHGMIKSKHVTRQNPIER